MSAKPMNHIDRLKNEIRSIISGSEVPEDPVHAQNTLEWLLKLKPDADDALKIAAQHNLKSVAFPAIGAGVGGPSEYDSAKAIATGVCHFARSPQSVREITLVGLNKYVCDCFCKAFDEVQE